jgi:hypothetical protein
MRVPELCYYFYHKLTDLIYTFSKWLKAWNYTILKTRDRPAKPSGSAYTILVQCPKQKAASRK